VEVYLRRSGLADVEDATGVYCQVVHQVGDQTALAIDDEDNLHQEGASSLLAEDVLVPS